MKPFEPYLSFDPSSPAAPGPPPATHSVHVSSSSHGFLPHHMTPAAHIVPTPPPEPEVEDTPPPEPDVEDMPLAEVTVDTDGRKVKTVVDQICSLRGRAGEAG